MRWLLMHSFTMLASIWILQKEFVAGLPRVEILVPPERWNSSLTCGGVSRLGSVSVEMCSTALRAMPQDPTIQTFIGPDSDGADKYSTVAADYPKQKASQAYKDSGRGTITLPNSFNNGQYSVKELVYTKHSLMSKGIVTSTLVLLTPPRADTLKVSMKKRTTCSLHR